MLHSQDLHCFIHLAVCPHTLSTQGKPNASAKGDHPRYWVTVGGTGDQKTKQKKVKKKWTKLHLIKEKPCLDVTVIRLHQKNSLAMFSRSGIKMATRRPTMLVTWFPFHIIFTKVKKVSGQAARLCECL